MGWFDDIISMATPMLQKKTLEQSGKQVDPQEFKVIQAPVSDFIAIDKQIRTKYKNGWINRVRKVKPQEVVIHGTGGGNSVEGFMSWMYNDGRPGYNDGIGLFHYLIGPKGEVIEIIDPEYWVYHSHSDQHSVYEIGIEMMNSSKSNRDAYTQAQYDSVFKLIFEHLIPLYPSISRICGHRYNMINYNPKNYQTFYYQCPGEGFKLANLDQALTDNGFTCKQYQFDQTAWLRYELKQA